MKRALLLALALPACVPKGSPADEPDPRGGVEITLAPSDATRGVPFQAAGGWTVTIDRFALVVQAFATHIEVDAQGVSSNVGNVWGAGRFMTPGPGCSVRVTGIDRGTGAAAVALGANFSSQPIGGPPCDIDSATLARFEAPADNDPSRLPDVILHAHGDKDGRRVDVDLALTTFSPKLAPKLVTIVENVGLPVSFPVDAEVLVDSDLPTGVTFEQIAGADLFAGDRLIDRIATDNPADLFGKNEVSLDDL